MIPIIGDGGLLAANMHFARVLRAAGLPIGPGKVIDAINAVSSRGSDEETTSTGRSSRVCEQTRST